MATAQGIRAGRAYVELGADSSKLKRVLAKARASCAQFANGARSKLELGAAIAAPVAVAVKTFADFDDQMRLVQGVTGATGQAFEQLTATAKKLGATTSWTAAQVAEGMVSLGRAGFQSEEIDASIKGVMDLARATGTEIGPATDIAGNALRSFGLQASEMGRVCDVLTATANGSAQTLEDLGEAFKYVAPLAASTGATIEDTAKIVGALANFGVKGSQAGTVFKNIPARMATDKNAQKKYLELGIDVTDAEGNLRKVNDVLMELGERIKNMPTAEKLETIKTLFGQYGLTGVSLTAANFKELNDAIDQAGGTASRVAETMDAGIGGTVRVTKSAIEGLAISVGEALVPYLSELAQKIQGAASWLSKFNSEHPGVISNVAKFAASLVAMQGALWLGSKAAIVFIDKISLAGRVLSGAWKAGQAAMNGCRKAGEILAGVQKANQAALAAQVAYDTKLIGLAQARTALNGAKTASERAAAAANYATAQSEVAEAQAALGAAKAKQASAAASAKALAAGLALAGAVAGVAALAYAYKKWALASTEAAESAHKANEAQHRITEERSAQREADRQLFNELIALEKQQSLTNDQMARAQFIVSELASRYGDLGIKVDEFTRRVYGASAAQEMFNRMQKAIEVQDLKNELATMEAERSRTKKSLEDRQHWWTSMGEAIGGMSSREQLEKDREQADKIKELTRNINAMKRKIELAEKTSQPVESFDQPQFQQQWQQPAQQPQFPAAPNFPTVPAPARAPETPSVPEKEPELPKGFEPEKFDDFFKDAKGFAERFKTEVPAIESLELPEINVDVPEIEIPEIDPYNIQLAADSAVESARKTEAAGTFDAFEALDVASAWERDEMRRQTVAQQTLIDETRRTNKILANKFAQDDDLFI